MSDSDSDYQPSTKHSHRRTKRNKKHSKRNSRKKYKSRTASADTRKGEDDSDSQSMSSDHSSTNGSKKRMKRNNLKKSPMLDNIIHPQIAKEFRYNCNTNNCQKLPKNETSIYKPINVDQTNGQSSQTDTSSYALDKIPNHNVQMSSNNQSYTQQLSLSNVHKSLIEIKTTVEQGLQGLTMNVYDAKNMIRTSDTTNQLNQMSLKIDNLTQKSQSMDERIATLMAVVQRLQEDKQSQKQQPLQQQQFPQQQQLHQQQELSQQQTIPSRTAEERAAANLLRMAEHATATNQFNNEQQTISTQFEVEPTNNYNLNTNQTAQARKFSETNFVRMGDINQPLQKRQKTSSHNQFSQRIKECSVCLFL